MTGRSRGDQGSKGARGRRSGEGGVLLPELGTRESSPSTTKARGAGRLPAPRARLYPAHPWRARNPPGAHNVPVILMRADTRRPSSAAFCPLHRSNACRSCPHQDLPLDLQLARKQQRVAALLAAARSVPDRAWQPPEIGRAHV